MRDTLLYGLLGLHLGGSRLDAHKLKWVGACWRVWFVWRCRGSWNASVQDTGQLARVGCRVEGGGVFCHQLLTMGPEAGKSTTGAGRVHRSHGCNGAAWLVAQQPNRYSGCVSFSS